MSKAKSVFVTALFALMLALILVGLYMLELNEALLIIVALLGMYGFLCAAFNFCLWLGRERHLPAHLQEEEYTPDEDFFATYDAIKAESKGKSDG